MGAQCWEKDVFSWLGEEGLYAVFKELRIREESGLVTRDTIGSEEGGRVISGPSWKLEGPEFVGEGREERGRGKGEGGERERLVGTGRGTSEGA